MVRLVDHGISLINKAWSGAAILVDISRIVEEHHHTGCLSSSKSNHSLLFFLHLYSFLFGVQYSLCELYVMINDSVQFTRNALFTYS